MTMEQVKLVSTGILAWFRFPLVNKSIRDDPYWISRVNSLELIGLSSINKVSLV